MSCVAPRRDPAQVISNRRLTSDVFSLVLRLPTGWGPPRPGQFVQLECPPRDAFGLRRPFSLAGYRVAELGVEVTLVYGSVGQRTRALAQCLPGETLSLVGPLGHPFVPFPGRLPILVGGGRGIAPLLMLADLWKEDYPDGLILYGARSDAALIPIEAAPYPVHRATDDGSAGFHGTVIELLAKMAARGEIRSEAAALFACGPNRMLAALAGWSKEGGFPCQASLETHFGCGVGICAGCAVPVLPREGEIADAFGRYALACQDGPVMDARRVEWEGVRE